MISIRGNLSPRFISGTLIEILPKASREGSIIYHKKQAMKKVLFYSPDFSLCYSLLIYLQDTYNVTSSTDFTMIKSLTKRNDFDLLIIDSEPDTNIEKFCSDIRDNSSNLKIVLTYVYNKNWSEAEKRMREYISAVFYKPYDLSDITKSLQEIEIALDQKVS